MKLPIGTYTFYNQLENCPHQAFHVYVAKTVPWVSTPKKEWGNTVHTAMENRIKHGSPLPDACQAAEKLAAGFHDLSKIIPVHVELKLAMKFNGAPCEYEDKDNAWFRGKLDCVVTDTNVMNAWMTDWKTGNVREDPFELECGALLLVVNNPNLKIVTAEYYWMKVGQAGLRYQITNHANTFERLHKLHQQARTYLDDNDWPKRKSPLCDWCAVKSCENYTGKKVEA